MNKRRKHSKNDRQQTKSNNEGEQTEGCKEKRKLGEETKSKISKRSTADKQQTGRKNEAGVDRQRRRMTSRSREESESLWFLTEDRLFTRSRN